MEVGIPSVNGFLYRTICGYSSKLTTTSRSCIEKLCGPSMILMGVIELLDRRSLVVEGAHPVEIRGQHGQAQASVEGHIANACVGAGVKAGGQITGTEGVDGRIALQFSRLHLQLHRDPMHRGDLGADAIRAPPGDVIDPGGRRAFQLDQGKDGWNESVGRV